MSNLCRSSNGFGIKSTEEGMSIQVIYVRIEEIFYEKKEEESQLSVIGFCFRSAKNLE